MRLGLLRPSRVLEAAIFGALTSVTRVLRALPSRWVMAGADRLADVVQLLDARGRRVARDNLRVVFGDALSTQARRRIARDSMRGVVRGVLLTLHASPLTPERVRRWLDVPAEVERTLREGARHTKGAVVISAHIGAWEMLVGLAGIFRDLRQTTLLVEPITHPAIDRFLLWLRGSGGGRSTSRRGGAVALGHHVRQGGTAALVVDRNARRNQGGIWAPFFGLDACTTPLPGFLARRTEVPIVPLFCIPLETGRYRVELGPELARDVHTQDVDEDIRTITTRINRLLEDRIRAHPAAWNWTLKRFKSRPTAERGPYPSYSLHDPH